jgi:8-oxo-dGTP diphosphatase
VAAAVVFAADGRVLITRRPPQVHQGGLWEFPGGKLETGEDAYTALRRELHEELGIDIQQARPLLRIHHEYPDKSVLLDVWRVEAFDGTAHGREGQPARWVRPDELGQFDFPAANRPIIAAARLPTQYLITPEPGADVAAYLAALDQALRQGIRLVQLRANTLAPAAYLELARQVRALTRAQGAWLLLNGDPALVSRVGADGVHLNSVRLHAAAARPLPEHAWVGASCHTAADLRQAAAIGADFAVLGPVRRTRTHPDAAPLGWEQFAALAERATVPVYALGGLGRDDLAAAWRHGAQGIAAIRGLWPLSNRS